MNSPAFNLVKMVWDHSQKSTSHSWLKLNHALSSALYLAVKSGMEFHEDEFQNLQQFNLGYWAGDLELLYRTAVVYRNSSAWRAFEAYRGRKPFIVKGASITLHTGDGPAGNGLERLVVGAQFKWKGELVTVSSFNDGKGNFTALSYCQDERFPEKVCEKCGHIVEWPKQKILHRHTINHADIREFFKKVKVAA